MMREQHVVRRRTRRIIKFNADLWRAIKEFTEKYYDAQEVTVETTDGSKSTEDMGEAYEYICSNTENIDTITVLAGFETELLQIEMKNNRDKYKYSMEIYCDCIDEQREENVRALSKKLIRFLNDEAVSFYFYLAFVAKFQFDYLYNFLSLKYDNNFWINRLQLTYVLLLPYVLVPFSAIVMMWLFVYRKDGLAFLTNYENVQKETRKRRVRTVLRGIIVCILLFELGLIALLQ